MAELIRFGVHGSPSLATRILRAMGRTEDGVSWHRYDVADPFRGLRAGEQDVMMVAFTLREPDLVMSRPLLHEPRAVAVGEQHPLAARESVSIEDLAGSEAFRCPGAFPSYVWDEVVPRRTPAGRPIHRTQVMDGLAGMADVLATTDTVHISMRSLENLMPRGIRMVPIHDLPPAPFALARLRGPAPSHIVEFIAEAEAAAPC